MSRELKALKTIKIKCHPNSNPSPIVDEALKVVEQALQRLEAIDNAKSSEALEKLLDGYSKGMAGRSYYDTIKQALLKSQEQKRALEILFKKEVDITLLSRSVDFKSYNHSYTYVKGYDFSANKEITEEEYELLTRYYNER